jgi:hypothetical protein
VCPGYSKKLKWICGPVSKGPYQQKFQEHNEDGEEVEYNPRQSQNQDQECIAWQETSTPITSRLGSYATSSTAAPFIETQLRQPGTFALLGHFTEIVANQLAWYDNDKNPWRNLIVPLAMDSHALFAAILAMSSGNIVARMEDNSAAAGHHLQSMQLLREKTLTLLSADFRKLSALTKVGSWLPSDARWATAILASAILLSYLEIHFPVSGVWRVHLRAARQVMGAIQQSSASDELISFLAGEYFAATTWSMLTEFDVASHATYDYPEEPTQGKQHSTKDLLGSFAISHGDSGFAGFCLGLQEITRLERLHRQEGRDVWLGSVDREYFPKIDELLSEARHRAFQAVEIDNPRMSETEELDVRLLIDAFYHATSIYKSRALQRFTGAHPTISYHRERLCSVLLTFRDPYSFAQDQTWPLFVAGTESKGDVPQQTWISGRFQCVMSRSCALDRPRVLNFLAAFWLQSNTDNWIDYARQCGTEASFLIL